MSCVIPHVQEGTTFDLLFQYKTFCAAIAEVVTVRDPTAFEAAGEEVASRDGGDAFVVVRLGKVCTLFEAGDVVEF